MGAVAGLPQGGDMVDVHAQADHGERITAPGGQVEAEVVPNLKTGVEEQGCPPLSESHTIEEYVGK
jgi:hypothetical protein